MLELVSNLYEILKPQLLAHGLIFIVYAILFVLVSPVLNFFNRGKDVSFQVRAMRIGIGLIFILHVIDIALIVALKSAGNEETDPQHFFIKLGYSIMAVYANLFAFNVLSYFSRKKFGLEKKIDEEVVYLDTYNSRLFDIVGYAVIFFVWIYIIISIWGLTSWLQTTGFIGITLGFLALTNHIWAPDIYYGMLILNSHMLEDGDVIKYNNHPNENIISRVTFTHTVLLDVRNNHRMMVRNSQLISNRVDNLTKRASVDGLRHSMQFNIGYPTNNKQNQEGSGGYADFRQRVQRMFEKAFAAVSENTDCKINRNIPFEISLLESGDYALKFSLSYYLEALPNTKVTKTIRQYLIRTPAIIQDAVNSAALEDNIQLATPVLIDHKSVDGLQANKPE